MSYYLELIIEKKHAKGPEAPLYTSPPPMTAKKFKDLHDIKVVLYLIYHKYYDDLPHL